MIFDFKDYFVEIINRSASLSKPFFQICILDQIKYLLVEIGTDYFVTSINYFVYA